LSRFVLSAAICTALASTAHSAMVVHNKLSQWWLESEAAVVPIWPPGSQLKKTPAREVQPTVATLLVRESAINIYLCLCNGHA
jgi:hypothetical protein